MRSFLGLVLFSLTFCLGCPFRAQSADPVPVRMMSEAWKAYEKEDYRAAVANADKVIEEFGPEAIFTQNELKTQQDYSAQQSTEPGVGRVSDAEKDRIFSFGPMNEVAAAWWLKGRIFARQCNKEQAISAYNHAVEYPYARVYDKDSGTFWSPARSAQARIAELQRTPACAPGEPRP